MDARHEKAKGLGVLALSHTGIANLDGLPDFDMLHAFPVETFWQQLAAASVANAISS